MTHNDRHLVKPSDLAARHLGRHVVLELPRGRTVQGVLRSLEHVSEHGLLRTVLRLADEENGIIRTVIVDDADTSVLVPTDEGLAQAVRAACDAVVIFPQDLAGGWRAEGWRAATDAIRAVVDEHQTNTKESES